MSALPEPIPQDRMDRALLELGKMTGAMDNYDAEAIERVLLDRAGENSVYTEMFAEHLRHLRAMREIMGRRRHERIKMQVIPFIPIVGEA